MSTQIPSFYRVFFASVDPFIALSGVLANLFAPDLVLDSYNPQYTPPRAAETTLLLDTVAGFLIGTIFLQVVLLRAKPDDLTVWRCLQASIMLVDFTMLAAFSRAFAAQGRTDWRVWRAEEWTNLGVTAGVAAMRMAFLSSFGFGRAGRGKRE